jgi:hypothetical protein
MSVPDSTPSGRKPLRQFLNFLCGHFDYYYFLYLSCPNNVCLVLSYRSIYNKYIVNLKSATGLLLVTNCWKVTLLMVTSGHSCAQFPQPPGDCLKSTINLRGAARQKTKLSWEIMDKDNNSGGVWQCNIYGEIVLFTVLALPCCDHWERKQSLWRLFLWTDKWVMNLQNYQIAAICDFQVLHLFSNLGSIPDLTRSFLIWRKLKSGMLPRFTDRWRSWKSKCSDQPLISLQSIGIIKTIFISLRKHKTN